MGGYSNRKKRHLIPCYYLYTQSDDTVLLWVPSLVYKSWYSTWSVYLYDDRCFDICFDRCLYKVRILCPRYNAGHACIHGSISVIHKYVFIMLHHGYMHHTPQLSVYRPIILGSLMRSIFFMRHSSPCVHTTASLLRGQVENHQTISVMRTDSRLGA